MELVTLQFPTARELWSFRLEIEATIFEFNLRDRTLTCQCSDDHIKLAIEKYNGKLISTDPDKIWS
jgi:hypothetical protein